MDVGSLAESLAVLVSPPPATEAVLITLAGALPDMFTASVIAGALAPIAIEFVVLQVAVWPEIVQVQPLPLAPAGIKPAGSISVTVAVPFDAIVPMLFTVSV